MSDFDPTAIMLSFFFGVIGLVAFRYGRKMQQTPPVVLGMALMIYPWFVSRPLWLAIVGACLTGGLWLWRD